MSADRETNHDMTDRDIALLLADAADEVEIGIAPYQAVIRGGRRRRARRWAIATAAALVITGTSGTLALAGLRDGGQVTPPATQQSTLPSTPEERHVYGPQETVLGVGDGQDKNWSVTVDEWGAPHNEGEAQVQLQAMREYGEMPMDVRQASELIGKSSFFVRRSVEGADPVLIMQDTNDKQDSMSGTDLQSAAMSLTPSASDGPERLVVGQVAKTAQQVTCTWKDGTTTVAHRVAEGADINSDESAIRPAAGSPVNWFVCVAPQGTTFKSVKVTK